MTAITDVSKAEPKPGEVIIFYLSGASASGKSVTCASGALTIVFESAERIEAICPTPQTFGSRNINYEADTAFTVNDPGGTPSNPSVNLKIKPIDGEFAAQVTALTGINALIPGLVIGDWLHARWLVLNPERPGYVDLATGVVGPGDTSTLLVTRYDTDPGALVWGATGQEFPLNPTLDDAFIDLGEMGVVKSSNPVWSTNIDLRYGGGRP